MQLRPQALDVLQAVLGQPGLELAFGLHLLLQCAQRGQSGDDVRQPRGLLLRFPLRQLARLVGGRRGFGEFREARVGDGLLLVGGDRQALHLVELVVLRRGQPLTLLREALAAAAQALELFVDAATFRGQHLDLLLDLRDLGALLVGAALRGAHLVLDLGQLHRLLLGLGGEDLALLLGLGDLRGDVLELHLRLLGAVLPLLVLRPQLGQALFQPLAAFDDVADALLQPADLHLRLGHAALRGVQFVAGTVVGLADGLQLGLEVTQLGHAGLERVDRLRVLRLHPRGLAGRVAVLQEPQLVQLQRALLLQIAVVRGDLGLALQLLEVVVELAQDVLDAGQVLARVAQAELGLAPALLVLRDAGGLLEEHAQFLRLGLDDPADRALADDGVGARPQAGAEEHVLHVATTHRLVVDEVAAGAVAGQDALDGDLGELVPLAAGAGAGVVEHQLHAGPAGRLAVARAVEDHVLHGLAAQFAGLAFAQHPAHRVHDVGLAAAVGADHADQLPGQLEGRRIGKGLEARELDRVQSHRVGPPAVAAVT